MSDYKNIDEDEETGAKEDKDEAADEDVFKNIFKNVKASIFKFLDAQRAKGDNYEVTRFKFDAALRAIIIKNKLPPSTYDVVIEFLRGHNNVPIFKFTDLQRAIYENDIASLFMFTDESEPASVFTFANAPTYENSVRLLFKSIDVHERRAQNVEVLNPQIIREALASPVADKHEQFYPLSITDEEELNTDYTSMRLLQDDQEYLSPDILERINNFSSIAYGTGIISIVVDSLENSDKLLPILKIAKKFAFPLDLATNLFLLRNTFALNKEKKERGENSDKEEAILNGIATGSTIGGFILSALGTTFGGGFFGGIGGLAYGVTGGGTIGGSIAEAVYPQRVSELIDIHLGKLKIVGVDPATGRYITIPATIEEKYFNFESDKRIMDPATGLLVTPSQLQTKNYADTWLDLRDPFFEFYNGLIYKNLHSELSPSMMMLLDVHNSRSNSGSIINVIDALEKSSIQAETDKVSPWSDLSFLKPMPNGTNNTDSLSKTPITRDSAHETETAPPPITGPTHSETIIELAKGLNANLSGDAPRGSVQLLHSGAM